MKKAQIIMLITALIIAMSGCAAENNTVKEQASTASDTVGTSSETLKAPEAVPDISDNAVSDTSAETTVITTSTSESAAASETAATTETTKAKETTTATKTTTTTSAAAAAASAAEAETQARERLK